MRGHCERLTVLAMRLGLTLGLGEEEIETIRLGALLHDIGKIGIPDRILLKPGSLTPEETELMRTHTIIGDNLLEPIELLAVVRPIVRSHHERWDGHGYPDGIAGEEIPLGARIMGVADAVEAMSAKRVYREALCEPEIVRELERGRGTQWDPTLVDLVLKLIETEAVSFSADGLRISQVLPQRARCRSSFSLEADRPSTSAHRRRPPSERQPIRCLVADDHPGLVAAVSDFLENDRVRGRRAGARRPRSGCGRAGRRCRSRARGLPDAPPRGRSAARTVETERARDADRGLYRGFGPEHRALVF